MRQLFSLTSFLAAFLLFQIELIMARIMLPAFGGGYPVWGACLVFFQGVLLSGYLYSHLILRWFGIVRYARWHQAFLLLPLFFFPGRDLGLPIPNPGMPLVLDVAGQLAMGIGVVFFVLSTTGIILQGWWAASDRVGRTEPYVLYAASNLGSFVALASYPFIIEPFLDLDAQLLLWRIGYAALLVLHWLAGRSAGPLRERALTAEKSALFKGQGKAGGVWFWLGAAGVMMFMAVTNIITYEIAPVPLFWIIPLSIYLITFTLNFAERSWCPGWIRTGLPVWFGLSVLLFFVIQKKGVPLAFTAPCLLVALFLVCMFCQNELYRRRPADSRGLTAFYLWIATGGLCGSVLVSWLLPLVTTSWLEYLIALFIVAAVVAINDGAGRISGYGLRLVIYSLLSLLVFPVLASFGSGRIFLSLAALFTVAICAAIYYELGKSPRALCLGALAVLLACPLIEPVWNNEVCALRHRNYYGTYRVCLWPGVKVLMHGTTAQGEQYLDPGREREPLLYYHRLSPVGQILGSDRFDFRNIGVVGLGVGALASYLSATQTMDFFELDPDIEALARRDFCFIREARGRVRVFTGDARFSLRKLAEQKYDLLIVDAFSGDSVPVHLLTVEAIQEYRVRLAAGGIILFHVTNRYLDLVPVLFSNARAVNARFFFKANLPAFDQELFASRWVALTWDKRGAENLAALEFGTRPVGSSAGNVRCWTDRFSYVTGALRWRVRDGRDRFQQHN